MSELLPCPFCGGAAHFRKVPWHRSDPKSGGHYVECEQCLCCTPLRFECGDDPRPLLAEAWNRRAHRAEPSAEARHG